jgi:hypothetical protein
MQNTTRQNRAGQNRKWKVHLTIVLAGIAVLNGIVFWNSRERVWKGYGDFSVFYTAGRILAAGEGRQLYDQDLQFRVEREFAPQAESMRGPLPYIHPPFEGLLFIGLAGLTYFHAYCIWTALNLAILLSLPGWLRPYLSVLQQSSVWVWLLAMLAFFPLGLALVQGQDAILLLLMIVLAYRALRRSSDLAAGCWLGLGLFRPQIALPLALLLVVQKKWRSLIGFAGVAVGLGLISVLMLGWRTVLEYPDFLQRAEEAFLGPASQMRMPNLHGLLVTAGAGLSVASGWISGLTALASIGLLVLVARDWRWESGEVFDLGFSMAVVSAVLVSYHAFVYDLTILSLPFALVTDFALRRGRRQLLSDLILLLPIALLLLSPLHFLLGALQTKTSLLALVLLVWLGGLAWEVRRIRAAAALN